MQTSKPDISVVVPVYNESGNIVPLTEEVVAALSAQHAFEIVFVDDCSTDTTPEELQSAAARFDMVRIVRHESNLGQSAGLCSGVAAATADVVAVIDGDGQNDPADIPKLLDELTNSAGVRLVIGQRVRRQDSWLKLLSSRVANTVRASILKDGVPDTGCGIKTFYRKDFMDLPAFDHMHRFLPALLGAKGAAVRSVPVNHRPRVHGISKYNVRNRLWVGITDLLGVLWLQKRQL